jgi:hypothetical protein
MTMILDGTSGVTFPNSTTQAGAGKILQVVNVSNSTSYSTGSSTYSASGMSASITPTFSTSKILILARIPVSFPAGVATGGAGGGIALYRSSTALYTPQAYEWYLNLNSISPRGTQSINYLDSPATSSSVTYNFYFASYSSAAGFTLNETGPSGITLMEVAP